MPFTPADPCSRNLFHQRAAIPWTLYTKERPTRRLLREDSLDCKAWPRILRKPPQPWIAKHKKTRQTSVTLRTTKYFNVLLRTTRYYIVLHFTSHPQQLSSAAILSRCLKAAILSSYLQQSSCYCWVGGHLATVGVGGHLATIRVCGHLATVGVCGHLATVVAGCHLATIGVGGQLFDIILLLSGLVVSYFTFKKPKKIIIYGTPSLKEPLSQYSSGKKTPTNEPRKKPSYFPLYWLFNRDPYNWFIIIPIFLGSFSSPIYPKQPGALFSLLKCMNGPPIFPSLARPLPIL